jgi:hypothetical protein
MAGQMGTAAVRERLGTARAGGTNGETALAARGIVSGAKLTEAAAYLKQARIAVLNWSKEAYLGADQVDRHIDDIREILDLSETLLKARMRLEAKAQVFGA